MISGALVVVEISNFSSSNDWLAYLVVDIKIYDESIVIQSQSITKELVTEIERYTASFHLQISNSNLLDISEF